MNMSYQPAAVSVRPLGLGDIPAALAIQSEEYPAFLREGEEAFASRLNLADSYCLAATRGGALIAYLIAHGWPSQAPPPVDVVLMAEAASEVLFIHDLAVSSKGRGLGIGRRLIERAFELAACDGLQRAELIAVEGAASYWRALGFCEAAAPVYLAEKVAAYGPEARWMNRDITVGRAGPVNVR